MRLSSTLSKCVLKTFSDRDSNMNLVVPVTDFSYGERCLSSIRTKPLPVRCLSAVLYLLLVAFHEHRTSVLFIASL